MPKANDLTLYEREARGWWNPSSQAFRSLQSVNAFHAELLREWLGEQHAGRTVVDLGCGGGLMAKFFVDAGARVVGVDVSQASLRVAEEKLGACFVRGDVLRAPLAAECADIVLLADVLEHFEDPARAISEAARVLRPGGVCFAATTNRTLRARIMAVWLGEGLALIPRGTHDARLFVKPAELERYAADCGLRMERLQGGALVWGRTIQYWTVTLRRGRGTAVTYSALMRKPGTGPALGLTPVR